MDRMDGIVYLIDNSLGSFAGRNKSVSCLFSITTETIGYFNKFWTKLKQVLFNPILNPCKGCAEDENKKQKSGRSR